MIRAVRTSFLLLILILTFVIGHRAGRASPSGGAYSLSPRAFLPIVTAPIGCPTESNRSYAPGTAFQFDLDDPVRPAGIHADKNLALRGIAVAGDPGLKYGLINYGSNDPRQPPQFATLFNPARVPIFNQLYRVHIWWWAPSPEPGTRGDPILSPPVTALGVKTTAGEEIRVPASGYDIGGGMQVIILFADEDTVALRYTREDSSGSAGYTLHIDKLCTDPNLLGLYRQLDNPNGRRYNFVPPQQRPYSYDLPTLPAGKVIGIARGSELVVAISDTGMFQDPRSCNEWWQIRPGFGKDCSPY